MRIRFWVLVAALVLSGVGICAWLTTSLLFLKVVAPQVSTEKPLILGSKDNAALQPLISRAASVLLPRDAQEITRTFSHWVYSGVGETNMVVTLGNNKQELPEGWQRHSIGWITLLSNQAIPKWGWMNGGRMLKLAGDIMLGRIPFIQPSLYVEIPGNPGPLYLTGKMKGGALSFVYSLTGADKFLGPIKIAKNPNINELNIALPSAVLEKIPDNSKQAIQDEIIAGIGLTKSRPDIITLLEGARYFGVTSSGTNNVNNFAVGAAQGLTEDIVSGWVGSERGYLEPVQHAFRLPDGTVGYELIPSADAKADFSDTDQDGCRQSKITAGDIWFCTQGEVGALATDRDSALLLVHELSNSLAEAGGGAAGKWRVVVPADYLKLLSDSLGVSVQDIEKIQGVYLEGNAFGGRGYAIFTD